MPQPFSGIISVTFQPRSYSLRRFVSCGIQRFAPQMKEIQKKYKADKQKQNEELMKFYKENSINPAASCLPMLLQFPVFIALYYTLKHFDANFNPGPHS